VEAGINASIRLDGKNEFQPDLILRIKSARLARLKVAADGLLEGAPELAAEIAVSSAAYDLHEKKSVYQRGLVPEYFVWQVMDSQIHWFALDNGEYVEMKPQSDGAIHSGVFPGLWLDIRALLAGDEQKVSRSLEKGLKSAEHAAFLKKLAAAK
jgi:Uma2 family endonuclease